MTHRGQMDEETFRRVVEPQLRRQYQQALEALCAEMKNPDRERKMVWQRLSQLMTSGIPAQEHIPTLVELERIAREAGGTAYVEVEQTVFEEMAKLSHPDLVPFMIEAFRYRRRYDNFAVRRREYSVDVVAVVAARTGDAQAIAAMGEMLEYPAAEVRGVSLDIIYEAYEREGCEMQPAVLDHFWRLGRSDPDRRVRQTALAFLNGMGHISYAEAIELLEGKA